RQAARRYGCSYGRSSHGGAMRHAPTLGQPRRVYVLTPAEELGELHDQWIPADRVHIMRAGDDQRVVDVGAQHPYFDCRRVDPPERLPAGHLALELDRALGD